MKIIEIINNLILKSYRKKRLYLGHNIKLNLGSGSNTTKDYINIDASFNAFFTKFPRIILGILYHFSSSNFFKTKDEYIDSIKNNKLIHYNLEKGIPIKDNTVIKIYSNDFLEHLFYSDSKMIIQECYRVLKKGGVLEICTQDLDKLVKEYLNGNTKLFNEIIFNKKEEQYFSMHKFFYNFYELKKLLEETGFKDVVYIEPKGNSKKIEMIVKAMK